MMSPQYKSVKKIVFPSLSWETATVPPVSSSVDQGQGPQGRWPSLLQNTDEAAECSLSHPLPLLQLGVLGLALPMAAAWVKDLAP